MTAAFATTLAATLVLAACALPAALPGANSPEMAAKNRPLEERCATVQKVPGGARAPGETSADVRAEAAAAAKRGELDKACGWL